MTPLCNICMGPLLFSTTPVEVLTDWSHSDHLGGIHDGARTFSGTRVSRAI